MRFFPLIDIVCNRRHLGKAIMQYKLYVENLVWLPEIPNIDVHDIRKSLVVIDVPQLYAVGGLDRFYDIFGLKDYKAHKLISNAALREKFDLLTSMLPVLHKLQDETVAGMVSRMETESDDMMMISGDEKQIVERKMLDSTTSKSAGCILCILSNSSNPADICPVALNPKDIMAQAPVEIFASDDKKLQRSKKTANAYLATKQARYKSAVSRRMAAARRIMTMHDKGRIHISEDSEFTERYYGLRGLLTSEFEWYKSVLAEEYSINIVDDAVHSAPRWTPFDRPAFEMNNEELKKTILEEAERRVAIMTEKCQRQLIGGGKHFEDGEEFLNNGIFARKEKALSTEGKYIMHDTIVFQI